MMKKTTQTFLLVFSTLLLFVSVTGSAQGQPANRPTPEPGQDRRRGNGASFSGTWNTVTDKGKKIVMTLRHERTEPGVVTGNFFPSRGLTGSYKPSDSSINGFVKASWRAEPVLQTAASIRGKLTDNVLRFTWSQDNAQGAGRFTLSSDGESFEGTYSRTNNPDDTSGGTWHGTRAPNFQGVWQTKVGEQIQFPQLLLQQANTRVVGQLYAGVPQHGVIREGTVDGNTLRFQVWRATNLLRPDLYDLHMGNGELVMNADGKSFKGTILGAATSGTLIGR